MKSRGALVILLNLPGPHSLPLKMGINEGHPLRAREHVWGASSKAQLVPHPSPWVQEPIIPGSGPPPVAHFLLVTHRPPHTQRAALPAGGSSPSSSGITENHCVPTPPSKRLPHLRATNPSTLGHHHKVVEMAILGENPREDVRTST